MLFWETVGRGVGCHLVPHVERVLRPLRQFLRHQCAASGDCAILCDAVDRGRVVCRLGVNLSGLTMGVTGYTIRWKIGGLWSGGAYGIEGGLLTTVIVVLLYFYLEKAPIQPQEPYLLYKDRS